MSGTMSHNRNPLSMREGKAYINGVEVLDSIKLEIKFTPEVWTGKQLGDRTNSSRWLGYSIVPRFYHRNYHSQTFYKFP